jgi:hypothetical protein
LFTRHIRADILDRTTVKTTHEKFLLGLFNTEKGLDGLLSYAASLSPSSFFSKHLLRCPWPAMQLSRAIFVRTFAKGAGVSYNGLDMAEKSTAGF